MQMFLRAFLLVLCFVINSIPFGQSNHTEKVYLRFYTTAEKLFNTETPTDTTDSLALSNYSKTISALKNGNSNDPVLLDCYTKSGIISMAHKDDREALNYFLQSISLRNESHTITDSLLFKPYLYAGNTYHDLFDMDSALYYYNKAEGLISRYPAIGEAERLYNQAGVIYYETGDYKKSIIYFGKALSIAARKVPVNKIFIVNYRNNIASAYRKSGDFEQALTIYKNLLPYNINTNELLHNIGVTLLDAGKNNEAIAYLKKVRYNNQSKLNDVGRAYLLLHNKDSALYYFNMAIRIQNGLHINQKNRDYAYSLKYVGDIMTKDHQYDLAVKNYQLAIIQADPDFNDTSVASNPRSFYGLHQSFFLFDILTSKARALQLNFTQTNNYNTLKRSFDTYSSGLELAQQVERIYTSDESRLFLKKNADPVYKEAVEAGLQLYEKLKDTMYLFKVVKYIEDDKASVLQANLHESELSGVKNLPQDLLQEERNLKSAISGLTNIISQTTDTILNRQLLSKIQDEEIRLSEVQAKLNDNPSYHKLKFDPLNNNMHVIQQLLQKDEAILSYYYTAGKLLCFYITRDTFGYVSENHRDTMTEKILKLRHELSVQDQGDKRLVNELSQWLYGYLVRPVVQNIKDKKHLVVIPYNEIGFVPFEILMDSENDELLLNRFAISYNYTLNLIARYKPGHDSYRVLSFAPFANFTTHSKTLVMLKASREEVIDLPGKVLLDSNGTKNNFLKFQSQYPIIHLATHAIVDDKESSNSFIAFYPSGKNSIIENNVYEREIYNLDMADNQLVILSACETGNGQVIGGEGIISLSRAFFYAGCKSVVTSIWKAEDQSVTFITKHMHGYLERGYAKDEALQLAKLDYLKSGDIEPRFKTPAYWAPLVLTGDFNPVVIEHGYRSYLIIFVIIILAAGILLVKIKSKLF